MSDGGFLHAHAFWGPFLERGATAPHTSSVARRPARGRSGQARRDPALPCRHRVPNRAPNSRKPARGSATDVCNHGRKAAVKTHIALCRTSRYRGARAAAGEGIKAALFCPCIWTFARRPQAVRASGNDPLKHRIGCWYCLAEHHMYRSGGRRGRNRSAASRTARAASLAWPGFRSPRRRFQWRQRLVSAQRVVHACIQSISKDGE